MNRKPIEIELLAPARDAATAIEAIRHGADAVYIGAPTHGARAAAGNSLADIRRVVEFAHRFGARVYVTVNTLVLDGEIAAVERLIADLYRAEVDALIVQDMSILRMDIPPIALHASTQCDIRTPERARFLADAGFSQLVVARELSVAETEAIHRAVPDTALEAFVHGALCVSYSGDCQAGWALARRSANRGECPQICRQAFDLIDGNGTTLLAGKHLLSLRDLNRSAHIGALIEAGVTSFKIEGRLKDVRYVKTVVAVYRRIIDKIIAASDGRCRRSSFGRSDIAFTPDLNECFNRGYTDYFTTTRGLRPDPAVRMACIDSPKWTGTPIGTTTSACRGRRLMARLDKPVANGDGIGWFDASGTFRGVRVNRVDGRTLHLAADISVPAGTRLYRNHNKALADILEGETARRTVSVDFTLRPCEAGLALDAACERGASATVTTPLDKPLDEARTTQADRQEAALRKTGDTIYEVAAVDNRCSSLFIPAGVIADLRRRALEALDRSWRSCYRFDYRHPQAETPSAAPMSLSYHWNVANRLARSFYTDRGATEIEPALETASGTPPAPGLQVMHTRYCLRRELGACRLTPDGAGLTEPLTLRSGNYTLECRFDCANCRMSLHLPTPKTVK